MQSVDISVIIPTRNRAAWLPTCLAHLEHQTFPSGRFEVLVVDDGSADDTVSVVERYGAGSPVCIRCLSQSQDGPGAARNGGIREASGDLLLFLNDDELASPRLLEQHVNSRQAGNADACIMGDIRRHPQLPQNTFTRLFLELQSTEEADVAPKHFLDCARSNFSLPRTIVENVGGFNALPGLDSVAVWELAFRLDRANVSFHRLPDARAYVWQPTTFAAERFRQYQLGYGLKHLQHLTRSPLIPHRFRLTRRRFKQLAQALTIPYYVRACNRHESESSMLISSLYKRVLHYDRYVGYQDACQDRPFRPPAPEDVRVGTPAAHAD